MGEDESIATEECPFLAKIDPNVLAYLDVYRSHPAFTAAITTLLFESSTLATGAGAGQ